MTTIGVTGGIGSGKSTVAAMLVRRGAVLVDADVLAREAMSPGSPAYEAVLDRFGSAVVGTDGLVDRQSLAQVVFSDALARRDLNAIVHPEVARLMAEAVRAEAGSGRIVVLDVPLLVESGGRERYELDGVLVVDAPVEIAVSRLTAERGMSRDDARARVAAQASRSERLAAADYVILNVGTLDELSAMVERAWTWALELAEAG